MMQTQTFSTSRENSQKQTVALFRGA